MTARWIVNLLLLLLLGLLALAIRHELTVVGQPPTLAGIDVADLRLIEVERVGEPLIQLERTPDGWRMREPIAIDADQGRIDQLLGIVAAPVQRSFLAQSAALDELGLAPVKLSLRLDGLTLAFGGLDPVGQRRYVSADGLVHLIDDRYQHLLIAPPIDYCSRALLPHGAPPVFATLNGVPLAAKSLKQLIGLTAERIDPMTGDLSGEPVQFKFADGRVLRFLVATDRRRWSRPDLKLRYVLSDGMLLELDPTAIDRTPPPPAPALPPKGTMGPTGAAAVGRPPAETHSGTEDPFAPAAAAGTDAMDEAPVGAPPSVRLSPDAPDAPDEAADGTGFGAEPGKQPPAGFGIDPFAPDADPGVDSGVAPGAGPAAAQGIWPGAGPDLEPDAGRNPGPVPRRP